MTVQGQYLVLLVESILCLVLNGTAYTYERLFFGAAWQRSVMITLTMLAFAFGFVLLGYQGARAFGMTTNPMGTIWIVPLEAYSAILFIPLVLSAVQIWRMGLWVLPGKLIRGLVLLPRAFLFISQKTISVRGLRSSAKRSAGRTEIITTKRYKLPPSRVSIPFLIILFLLAIGTGFMYAVTGFAGSEWEWVILSFPLLAGWICSASIHRAWAQVK